MRTHVELADSKLRALRELASRLLTRNRREFERVPGLRLA